MATTAVASCLLAIVAVPPPCADAADIEAGRTTAEACAACHGENGVSQQADVPSLAGQPDGFVQWQLVYFRTGKRKNEVMEPIAAALSDADIRNLGAYYASLPPPEPSPDLSPRNPALAETGAKLAREHRCTSCHKEDLSGQQATPRLAGQREEVLLKALQDYKSGARTGAGLAAMPEAVRSLRPEDFEALAHFMARAK